MRYASVIETAIGRVRVGEDFLPPPEALVPRQDNLKVTLSLSRRGVDFFKCASLAHASLMLNRRAANSACSLPHPNSGLPELGI